MPHSAWLNGGLQEIKFEETKIPGIKKLRKCQKQIKI